MSHLFSGPESAKISMATQSSVRARSDAVVTERLILFLVSCLLSLFFSLCHGGSRAWPYHSWFSVPWWVLIYWLVQAAPGAYVGLLTIPPASRALQSRGCCPQALRAAWQQKDKWTLFSRYHVECVYLLAIFKSGLQDSASTMTASGKGEAEGW